MHTVHKMRPIATYVACSVVCVSVCCSHWSTVRLQMFMSPKLSVIALSIVPPMALLSRIYGRYVQNITKQVQDSLAGATQVGWGNCYFSL